jgi:hypothetical protein
VFTYQDISETQGIQIPEDIAERAKSRGGIPRETTMTSLNRPLLIAVVVGALLTIVLHCMHGRR